MSKVLIAYIPVLHKGYLDLFARHFDCSELYLIGPEIYTDFDHIVRKDIRRVEPELMRDAISALKLFDRVLVLDKELARSLSVPSAKLVMSEDEVSHALADKAFQKNEIKWDKAFLRWHRDNTLEEQASDPDETISTEELDRQLMGKARERGGESLDWYRHVGAVMVRDGEILLSATNVHLPNETEAYEVGDPRSIFKRNLNIEISSAMHSEAGLIAEAARRGIRTEGCGVYVTDFPCPPCAKLIASSGFSKCYYAGGYSVLDGGAVMKAVGVKLVRVK
ncbi:MAG TPA: deaminase [Candidatus Paceibacterota bacterium]